jgi:hypothetical protein
MAGLNDPPVCALTTRAGGRGQVLNSSVRKVVILAGQEGICFPLECRNETDLSTAWRCARRPGPSHRPLSHHPKAQTARIAEPATGG